MDEGLQLVACPCCDAGECDFWAEEAGYNVVRCRSCALLYVNPRPTAEYIDGAVRQGLHKLNGTEVTVRSRRIAAKVPYYRRRISHLFADLIAAGRPVRWVDVGSGYGEFIEAARDVLPRGSEIVGVEPMTHKAEAASARGLNVVNGYLQPGQFEADVISNIDVFSHIPDYRSFLSTLVRNLRAGGEVMIETGNPADLERREQFPNELGLPDHLVFAGRPQIERYLHSAGLEVVRVSEERFDTVTQMLKNSVKLLIGRNSQVVMPYSSPYRQLIIRAKLAA